MLSLRNLLTEALAVFSRLDLLDADLTRAASLAVATLSAGGKLLICGNGGNACDAQHLAGRTGWTL